MVRFSKNCHLVTIWFEEKKKMKNPVENNHSDPVSEFILLGFPCSWEIQILLFSFFFAIYVLTLTGNLCIISAVWWDNHLHTPMYILLANFSFLEIWYVTSTVPSMLANLLSETSTISFYGCFLQFYFFFSMGTTETFFLSAMAFDRYLAICRPLHYPTVMTVQRCIRIGAGCWVCGFSCFLLPVYLISQLPFCGPNTIDHFLCDPGPLMKLSCVPPRATEIICAIFNSVLIFSTFLFITSSYTLVIRSVLRVPSAEGRHKAFSTCGSHLARLGPMNVSSTETTNSVSHFILMGFPSSPEMQLLYFVLFSVVYTLTLMGNATIVCAVRWDRRLHTPMYIFLGNFSLLEICYVTTTIPNMLANFLSTSLPSADSTTESKADTCLSTSPLDHGSKFPPSKDQRGPTLPAQNPAKSPDIRLHCRPSSSYMIQLKSTTTIL
ncbi:olfactory receptor 11H6-like [Enhydra lutris kenyoni]|uniref:Olfactory receptor 11H6-like n=1 Tax=Enhydra lutris kenyoni TaxID=391180 RepID=A0A2Y9KTK5_ENHLU|nr:olfactory receptor 11H6-like [Enhydra lutris kenyoni]